MNHFSCPLGRAVGRLGRADGSGYASIEVLIDTDPEDLWSALTEGERLARWMGPARPSRCRTTGGWPRSSRAESGGPTTV